MSILPFRSKEDLRKEAMDDAVIQLAFAGCTLANYLLLRFGSKSQCICGAVTPDPNNPFNHKDRCPVAGYYAAVENVRKASLLAIVILLLIGASLSPAQESHPINPPVRRIDWALFAANASVRALDTYSTRRVLESHSGHELELPGFVVNHDATMAAYSAGAVGLNYLVFRYLRRHGHPVLARTAVAIDTASVAPWAIHNLFVYRPAKPVLSLPSLPERFGR